MTPLLAKQIGFHASSYGWVMAMLGMGGFLGSACVGYLALQIKPLTLLNVALMFIGVAAARSHPTVVMSVDYSLENNIDVNPRLKLSFTFKDRLS